MENMTLITSKHFYLQPLADGIYAAIAKTGGSAISNSGLIDLGDQTLIFDTTMTPQSGNDLLQAAANLFGRSRSLIINSHYHNDHIWGNQVFSGDGPVISTRRTRNLIATAGMEEFQYYSQHSGERYKSLQAEYLHTTDPKQRKNLEFWVGYYKSLMDTLPHLKVCMPTITFEDRLEIQGNQHKAELIEFVGGHTDSDSILYLPEEGIIFTSDLLFTDCHPYLADGDPQQTLHALQEIEQLDGSHFVPGHGPVGNRSHLRMMIDYIEYCHECAQLLTYDEQTIDDQIAEIQLSKSFQGWDYPNFFQSNLRFLCERMNSINEEFGVNQD
jgi:cyclase